jgi:hypothetical protein
MLSLIPLLSTMLAAGPDHESQNPLYRQLRESGVPVTATDKIRLPAPTMTDGLSAEAQFKALKELAGEQYSVDELTRNSAVAPFILRVSDLKPFDPQAPARGVDLWFVVYGTLDMDLGGAFIDRALGDSRKQGKMRELKPEELAKRSTKLRDEKHEGYGHVLFNFLERVEIEATGHTYWTRTPDSMLAATEMDERFRNDAEFPNRWRSIEKGDGEVKAGPWKPFSGSGQYLKVTRLVEPQGALFVEYHLVFTEPADWFGGANLLRSKLPQAAQIIVRSMRRELLKEQNK